MKIKKWYFKNYKSYGPAITEINIDENGQLILLLGKNGQGKSSLISALDLALYGEEYNKRGKRLAKNNYPNRINGDMQVGVEFETDQDILIQRSMKTKDSSIINKLIIDKIPYTQATKLQSKIEEKIGFDFKTYKSFISMNVNNFKNFISLTPDEKRILLDKLFNIEQINELNKILKQLKTSNDLTFNSIQKEIDIYTQNIESLQNSINEINEAKENKIDNKKRISELKKLLESHKQTFLDLEENKSQLQTEIDHFNEGISKLRIKVNNSTNEIKQIQNKIDLYSLGKCPTCAHDLSEELNLLPELQENIDKQNQIKTKIQTKINDATNELNNLKQQLSQANNEYNKIYQTVIDLKSEYNELTKEKQDIGVEKIHENIKSFTDKKKEKETNFIETQKLKFVYDLLLPIWGENGIKRDIIDSIIDPINTYIQEDCATLNMRYTVELDNNFDAHIYDFNQEIDPETLSGGEEKKINLIIMLAYIKMLRNRSNINVLFLDEVFSAIDIEGIDDILKLFKDFAHSRNITVFLVHHSQLKQWQFDRIINVHKTTFSYIDDQIVK